MIFKLTLITACKLSLGQGNMFTGVCLSTGGGWSAPRGIWSPGGSAPGVTEYFDPTENPGPDPNSTEKAPLTQKTSYFFT